MRGEARPVFLPCPTRSQFFVRADKTQRLVAVPRQGVHPQGLNGAVNANTIANLRQNFVQRRTVIPIDRDAVIHRSKNACRVNHLSFFDWTIGDLTIRESATREAFGMRGILDRPPHRNKLAR
jgi:hypothetical protein